MSTPASSSRLGSEFDAFLFAPIGEDRNGLTLATLHAALSDPSLKPADAGKMAIRLIAQLPGRPAADLGSLGAPRIRVVVHPHVLMTAILFAIWTIWVLGMPATDPPDAPTPTDSAHAPTPLTVSSPVRPTLSGK